MANTSPIFVLRPQVVAATFVNGDGTTPKDLVTALNRPDGIKVQRIAVHSDDTAAVNLMLSLHDGSTAYKVGAVRVAVGSGNDGAVAAVNLLAATMLPWLDADGELFLPSGWKVQVHPLVAVTAAKTVTIVAFAGEY